MVALGLALGLAGCRAVVAADPPGTPPAMEVRAVEDTVAELYRTFSWDAGGEPDWGAMEALFAPGAAFVAPIAPGSTPAAVDASTFLADFAAWVPVSGYADSGLHERVVRIRADRVGRIAHAFVTFEGVVPGQLAAVTRGVDSIQFVLDGDAWRLVSFTTQYETPRLALPERFLPRR